MNRQETRPGWNEGLSLGIPGMDEEHRRFFSHMDDLNTAIAAGRRPGEIERCLQVIVQEARAHFDHENEGFVKLGYPHAERHAAAHRLLEKQLWDALRTCYATEPGANWAKKGLLIKQMLLDHFELEDLKYRDFLNKRAATR